MTIDYKKYWEDRYANGNNSGAGSYGQYGKEKETILTNLISKYNIKSITDFGCGDGNQIQCISVPYIGYDISNSAIEICRNKYKNDPSKSFVHIDTYTPKFSDMNMSLDVIYHIIDDTDLHTYMTRLFSNCSYVLIQSSFYDSPINEFGHIKHRDLLTVIKDYNIKSELIEYIKCHTTTHVAMFKV